MDKFDKIQDSIAVSQQIAGTADVHVLLFVKLAHGKLDGQLRSELQQAIKKSLSSRHVPAHIIQVADIPYTVNGKRMELAVRDVVAGKPHKDLRTVANPESLDEYVHFTSLSSPAKSKL